MLVFVQIAALTLFSFTVKTPVTKQPVAAKAAAKAASSSSEDSSDSEDEAKTKAPVKVTMSI